MTNPTKAAKEPARDRSVVLLRSPSVKAGAPAPHEGGTVLDFALDRSRNLNDAAYEQMRQALMNGQFAPGQTFTIRALASAFHTSPMPVRDALKRLVAEHALELRRNRSVALPVMSRARFQEILQIRLSLEPMIAARATHRATPALIDAMTQDHQRMDEAVRARDALRYLAANRAFHFRLYAAAETLVMLPVIESLWMQIGPHLHYIFHSQTPAPATAASEHHHMAVLRALRRQDAGAVSKALWDDLADGADSILTGDAFAS